MPNEFLSIVSEAIQLRPDAKIVLALEISSHSQVNFDAAMSAANEQDVITALSFFDTTDGRSSMAMKQMVAGLAALKRSGANIEIKAVDHWFIAGSGGVETANEEFPDWIPHLADLTGTKWNTAARDAAMGLNSLEACITDECNFLFLYAGSFHTQIMPAMGGHWSPEEGMVRYKYAPAGHILALTLSAVSVQLKHRGGTMNNDDGAGLKVKNWTPSTQPFVTQDYTFYCNGENTLARSVGTVSAAQ